MSMKNFNDTIGNRTRDLPVYSKVSQPTAPLHVPFINSTLKNLARQLAVRSFLCLLCADCKHVVTFAAVKAGLVQCPVVWDVTFMLNGKQLPDASVERRASVFIKSISPRT